MAAAASSSAPEPSIRPLLQQQTLKWIFVGGKGGVGKTTCSCSIAVQLARVRPNVLIVSTDPAHNLSDAFDQKFSRQPQLVKGFDNLFALEIDPDTLKEAGASISQSLGDSPLKDLISTVGSSIPGIDEASSFIQMLRLVEKYAYSVVVFDTAPTGHTLRLLEMPQTLTRGLAKFDALRSSLGGLMSQFGAMLGVGDDVDISGGAEQLRETAEKIRQEFTNPDLTTFVCVCIAEFLSLYETERLVQELARLGFDVNTIIINQLVNPSSDCSLCHARTAIQRKYLGQMEDLYEDFHLVRLPLLPREVRGPEAISQFSDMLVNPVAFLPPKQA